MFPVSSPPEMTYFEEQARFEAMLRHAKKGHILQKHEDLRREYERLVRVYEREAKYLTSQIALTRMEYLDKMGELEALNGTSRSFPKGAPKGRTQLKEHRLHRHDCAITPLKTQKQRRETLLFRIEKRGGRDVYIKTVKAIALLMSRSYRPVNVLELYAMLMSWSYRPVNVLELYALLMSWSYRPVNVLELYALLMSWNSTPC
ncbi:hypothetical protein Btru_014244 [Bulinus truncatus]|nr:hypothetical protein Btru_014244 [Bulinus truncatus]